MTPEDLEQIRNVLREEIGTAVREEIVGAERRITAANTAGLSDLSTEFTAGLSDLRTEFTVGLSDLRTEFTAGLSDLRTELIAANKASLSDLRMELTAANAANLSDLRAELIARLDVADRRGDRVAETLRSIDSRMAAITRWADQTDRDTAAMAANYHAHDRALRELNARVAELERRSPR